MAIRFYFDIFNLIKISIKNARLDLSGEINILSTDFSKAISIDDKLFDSVTSSAKVMKSSYPYLEVLPSRDLHELTIKFLSVNRLFSYEDSYFDSLQLDISKLIANIVDQDDLKIRVNFFGDVRGWAKIEKFIIVNNDKDLYFKITEVSPRNFIYIKLGKIVDWLLKYCH